MSKFGENVAKNENLLGVSEKSRKFGFGGRSDDMLDDSGFDVKRTLEACGMGGGRE